MYYTSSAQLNLTYFCFVSNTTIYIFLYFYRFTFFSSSSDLKYSFRGLIIFIRHSFRFNVEIKNEQEVYYLFIICLNYICYLSSQLALFGWQILVENAYFLFSSFFFIRIAKNFFFNFWLNICWLIIKRTKRRNIESIYIYKYI